MISYLRLLVICMFCFALHAQTPQSLELVAFNLQDLIGGHEVNEKDLPNDDYIIHFWATWCAECIKQEDSMTLLAKKYPIVGVLVRDMIEDDHDWITTQLHPYTFLLNDDKGRFSKKMNVAYLPTTLKVSKGKIIQSVVGEIKNVEDF